MMEVVRLCELLLNSKNAIAFTGAGMSTESGIPDFRSPGTGLWEKLDPALLHISVLRSDPETYYKNFKLFAAMGQGHQPNAGHFALAKLEEMGLIKKVVTQNVDSFHTISGSKNVLEVHGHLRECSCMKCGKVFPYKILADYLQRNEYRPLSPCCHQILRSAVVNFGDSLPYEFHAFMTNELPAVDFCLVIGTSLAVYPAAQIPEQVDKVAIINKTATAQDSKAQLVIHDSIGSTLEALVEEVVKRRTSKLLLRRK
ncbi:MAG TPA: Sir2 family NAD-dependent protein deacetylase [Negativicutes bacterium]